MPGQITNLSGDERRSKIVTPIELRLPLRRRLLLELAFIGQQAELDVVLFQLVELGVRIRDQGRNSYELELEVTRQPDALFEVFPLFDGAVSYTHLTLPTIYSV